MNINGTDLGQGNHSMIQLRLPLYEKGVDLICLT